MIQFAFLKGGTKEHLLLFYPNIPIIGVPNDEKIKIKFEVDTNPPPYATYEYQYRLLPSPYEVVLYDQSSLFAGKVHAVVCRGWRNRIKGRDLYDYVFYLARKTPLNLKHLKERFVQSGFMKPEDVCTLEFVKEILCKRFEEIDYAQAKSDVEPFIRDQRQLDLWSSNFFKKITEKLTSIDDTEGQ